jgi:GTP-binding protein HflX
VVSARTGHGIPELLAAIERDLPRLQIEIDALVPYALGGLVSRVHERGEVLAEEHTEVGTRLRARVDPALAAELDRYPANGQRR